MPFARSRVISKCKVQTVQGRVYKTLWQGLLRLSWEQTDAWKAETRSPPYPDNVSGFVEGLHRGADSTVSTTEEVSIESPEANTADLTYCIHNYKQKKDKKKSAYSLQILSGYFRTSSTSHFMAAIPPVLRERHRNGSTNPKWQSFEHDLLTQPLRPEATPTHADIVHCTVRTPTTALIALHTRIARRVVQGGRPTQNRQKLSWGQFTRSSDKTSKTTQLM